MSNKKRARRFLPYETDYKLLDKCRDAEKKGLYMVSILSIIIPVLNEFLNNKAFMGVKDALQVIDFIIIIGYYVLNVVTETFLYPATARKRRKGFLDNSVGSKYLQKPVTGYYSNDEIELGSKKIIVNCCENCFFTYNIAKEMLLGIIIKNVLLSITFIIVAYFGFRNNIVALPILQILLSSLFLTELIHHVNFIVKLKTLLEKFWNEFSEKHEEMKTFQNAILFLLDYETTLAYNKAPLSNDIYNKLRVELTKEWEQIKKRYDIK